MTVSITRKQRFAPSSLIKYTAAACLTLTLGGCNSSESDVQKVVIENLLAKDVREFGEFTEINDIGACQTVNTLGSNGLETGDLQAAAMKVDDVWKFMTMQKISHEECVTAMDELTKEILAKQKD
ncbi:MAG: hypothetical protein Q8R10_18585 [Pseudomonas sp.]|uniref:hypothetical protein n=1 Tax=Pseudomonas sp. TaxID=306 RepID=UPI00273515DF|nr:hypothetical protein [Pseudomonas sp.]MDP3848429.1 hypothetical protein [Pseudomonas sp.]